MKNFFVLCVWCLLLSGCAPAEQDHKLDTQRSKRIALTYDDAPRGDSAVYAGEARTDAIISQLKEAEAVPAAFFVTTRGLDKPEGRARIAAYAQAGHLIANHSDTHMWASRTETDVYIADIDTAESKLAEYANRRAWFRFPYLDEGGHGDVNQDLVKRDAIRAALRKRGLMNGYVSVDTFDWHLDRLWNNAVKDGSTVDMQALSEIYVDMVVEAAAHYDKLGQEVLGRRPAQVVLLHENDLAAHFTTDLVRGLRSAGWTIVSPDEAYKDPIASVLPVTPLSGSGRIAAMAVETGIETDEIFGHWSTSRKGIEARVEKAGVFQENAKAPE